MTEWLEEATARAENDAALLLRKAIGDKRVLIGDHVVWTEAEPRTVDVWVKFSQVVTPEQLDERREAQS